MSPRSEEMLAQAHERLAAARDLLVTGHPETAASAAYYAMLYAARAALSEHDRYAKSHSGVWSQFGELFVHPQRFPAELARQAAQARRTREQGDYEAVGLALADAEQLTANAERFVAAVGQMLGASP